MRARLLAVVVVGACASHHGGGSSDGGLDGVTALAITPADQTLTIAQGVAATSTYTVTGTYGDGHTEDVTSLVSLSLADESLGGFGVGGAFTTATDHGGTTQVLAQAGALQASTGVTIMFQETYTDPGSPGVPTTGFGGPPDPTRAPTLIYPNDGVVVPPNLGRLEFHFLPGANNTAFALTLQNSVTNITVYLACTLPMNNGCIYQPDPTLWSWLSQTNRGADPVTWSIQGTDATGTGVGTSSTMTLQFSNDAINGGIYYWTTTTQSIMRFDFGSTTQTAAEKYAGTELEGTCIGCHALSKDGTKLVAEVNGQNDGRTALLDVATKAVMDDFGSTPKSIFESWNPDGSQYAAVYADSGATNFNLMIMDGNTSALVNTIDVGGSSTHPTDHPDWSSDGTRIAYVAQGIAGTCQRFHNGSIYQVSVASGTPTPLVMAENNLENNYYPAYAPDNRLVVFDRSQCTSNNQTGEECDADSDPTATLMAVDSIAGGAPVAMTNANMPGIADGSTTALTNSFPKFNPFMFARTNQGGHLAWITFASTRKFGLRSPPTGTEPDENPSGTLLWMTAIDLDAPAGTDPSSAAFALPFQDLTTSNHIAQWTEQVVQIQ
jgi:hypothetical protein